MLHVRNTRDAVYELRQISRAAGRFELSAPVQVFGQRNEIDRVLRLAERRHPVEYSPVWIEKEIFGAKLLDPRIEHVIVEQDGTEDAAFGLKILRKRPVEASVGRHRFRFIYVRTVSGRK